MTGARRPRALPASERLRRATEFQAVFKQGKRVERAGFVALWHATPGARRAGFTVTRRVRGAVHRNRVRRRLREGYRLQEGALPQGLSVIFVGREGAEAASFAALAAEMGAVIATIRQRAGAGA
ncbi:MAG: ribonuclease P protein component [Candidatus Rokubacteria bacterium]|nr:ribonuclease P protein component [Candidatus Rokubacteria bacterium]